MTKQTERGTSVRGKIRAATVGSQKQFQTEILNINGQDIEIRQPSIRVRKKVRDMASIPHTDGQGNVTNLTLDTLEFLIRAAIESCYVPGTGNRVFDDADYESLMELPTGSWFDLLVERVSVLFNVSVNRKELEKN